MRENSPTKRLLQSSGTIKKAIFKMSFDISLCIDHTTLSGRLSPVAVGRCEIEGRWPILTPAVFA